MQQLQNSNAEHEHLAQEVEDLEHKLAEAETAKLDANAKLAEADKAAEKLLKAKQTAEADVETYKKEVQVMYGVVQKAQEKNSELDRELAETRKQLAEAEDKLLQIAPSHDQSEENGWDDEEPDMVG